MSRHTRKPKAPAARRDAAPADDKRLAGREASVAAREKLSHTRERVADRRDHVAHDREQAMRERERLAAAREQALRDTEAAQATRESHIARLRRVNEHLVIATIQAQTMTEEIERARSLMEHVAEHDFLTDLPNRILLMERLNLAIALAKRHGTRLALLFLDLDRFKAINDSLGHSAGDAVLQDVAQRLLATIRASDTASRLGGDEFVVLMTDVAGERAAGELADKLCAAVAAPYPLPEGTVQIGVTIGISMYPDDGRDAASLIRNADVAMYHGKNSGRDQYYFFRPEMNARALARQKMEADLHHALARHEFMLHYQPKVDLGSGAITGCEALLRWNHPELGPVAPARFIPVAEACGLIVPIGRWVLAEACAQAGRWNAAGLKAGPVAVNLSAPEFCRPDFAAHLRHLLRANGLAPARLQLEIAESVLMHDAPASAAILRELKQIGVLLALDDFGTGYSSLSYLRQFPLDLLKIDQSFVHQIGTPGDGGAIVSAAIAMGNSLGQRVSAEGVEQAAQLAFLREHHCDEGQGYLFSAPLDAAQFGAMLATRTG